VASELPDIPHNMRRLYRRLERRRTTRTRALADSGALVGCGGRTGAGTRGFPHREGSACGVWEAEAAGGSGGSGVRVLNCWAQADTGEGSPRFPRQAVSAPSLRQSAGLVPPAWQGHFLHGTSQFSR
jgi:hypothetical protein